MPHKPDSELCHYELLGNGPLLLAGVVVHNVLHTLDKLNRPDDVQLLGMFFLFFFRLATDAFPRHNRESGFDLTEAAILKLMH